MLKKLNKKMIDIFVMKEYHKHELRHKKKQKKNKSWEIIKNDEIQKPENEGTNLKLQRN